MWVLRERFPFHFIVFKRTACHLLKQLVQRWMRSIADADCEPERDDEHERGHRRRHERDRESLRERQRFGHSPGDCRWL